MKLVCSYETHNLLRLNHCDVASGNIYLLAKVLSNSQCSKSKGKQQITHFTGKFYQISKEE